MRRSVGITLVLVGGVLAVVLGLAATLGSGWSYAVLTSPSMQPWASPGALLLHRHVPASEIEVGDVITVRQGTERLVTHRVVRLADAGEGRVARLQGDRSRLPDPVPVPLDDRVARVEVVVPRLGGVLAAGAPVLWGGLVLLLVGGAALELSRRRGPPTPELPTAEPATEPVPDPRIEALLATCEQLADDGVAPVVLRDVVRVRVAAIVGLPSAERAGAVLEQDDGARFYVLACADADRDALALVPPASQRRHAGTAALDRWWGAVADELPPAAAAAVATWDGEA